MFTVFYFTCNHDLRGNGIAGANTPCPDKKSLQFTTHNCNKFRYAFIIFGTNHPDTPLY